MVRFKNQTIGITQVMFHKLGQITEIGGYGYFEAIRAEGEAQGIGGVVRNRKRRDFDIADDEFLAGANVFDARETLRGAIRQNALEFVVRGFGEIYRRAPENRRLHESAQVVRVFVGENDTVESFGATSEQIEAAKEFFFAKTGVDEESGVLGLKQCAIARTTRRENSNAKRDACPRRFGSRRG